MREMILERIHYNGLEQIIRQEHDVFDIVDEVCEAHEEFAQDYDKISDLFISENENKIIEDLFHFCKKELTYKIEPETEQTTKSPAAICFDGYGDCKHFAGFCGGILGSLKRKGVIKGNYYYRFAGYSLFADAPSHVFIIKKGNINDVWIDPVLNKLDQRSPNPSYTFDVKISKMIKRISGPELQPVKELYNIDYGTNYLNTNAEIKEIALPPEFVEDSLPLEDSKLEDAIKMLLYYGIIDVNKNINDAALMDKLDNLEDQSDIDALINNYGYFVEQLNKEQISGLFDGIWNSVKQIGLAPARGAYLALVSMNFFNLGTRIYKAAFNPDGSYNKINGDKIHMIWRHKLMGDTNLLWRAAKKGNAKKAILGIGVAPALPAWALAASAIIAAMAPIIKEVLGNRKSDWNLNDADISGMYGGQTLQTATSQNSITKYLPLVALGLGAYLILKK